MVVSGGRNTLRVIAGDVMGDVPGDVTGDMTGTP
jgi:hypothetical protein